MKLPRLLVLTDRGRCAGTLRDTVATAVQCGARAVVVREKDLGYPDRQRLADGLRALLEPVGGIVIMAGPRGAAVHLAAADPLPGSRPAIVGRSCHDTGEAARAKSEGCDYVTLSPVFPTDSKPGYGPALGPAGLAGLCAVAPPAYALGGVLPDRVGPCLAAGAYGVATMGAVMADPRLVSAYVHALGEASA